MTLNNFLKLHQNGTCDCISITEEPEWNYGGYAKEKRICEEVSQESLTKSDVYKDLWKSIKNRRMRSFLKSYLKRRSKNELLERNL